MCPGQLVWDDRQVVITEGLPFPLVHKTGAQQRLAAVLQAKVSVECLLIVVFTNNNVSLNNQRLYVWRYVFYSR